MDKYKDMTLAQLEALFTEKADRFATLTALAVPTVEQVEEARGLFVELNPAGEGAEPTLRDALTVAQSFASMQGTKFSTTDGAAEQNPEVAKEVPAEEQARTDQEGQHNTDEAAEQARVNHTEEVVDPVPSDQVPPGTVPDAEGNPTEVKSQSAVAQLAARGENRPEIPAHRRKGVAKIQAASGLTNFSHGQQMGGYLDVAKAVESAVQSFPTWTKPTGELAEMGAAGVTKLQKFGTATIDLGIPEDLMIDENSMSIQMQADVIDRAANETSLPGGSLTAAGGWCAPSETVYDLSIDATTDGMLSHPEVGINRGGTRWAVSPNFATFYANPGFKYTEAELIAGGITKPCVTIPCPSFLEARLNVEGLCIKVDIVSEVGYPEHVRNYIDGTMIAHQHWMNATKIAAMVGIAGAARVFTGLGSSVDDSLEALELVGNQTRQKYRLSLNSTLEVVVPFWVKDMFKADLRRRLEQANPVTDNQLTALFRAAKMNVQYVYDWTPLDETAEVYPATFPALVYPAGTFIFGTKPIITLNTVYDAASLAANQYTGLFTEQGWLVAKRKFHADLLTLPVCNAGRTGAANITCGV